MICLPRSLDSGTRDALAERLKFYRDLGLTEFYRRPVADDVEQAWAVALADGAVGG